MKFANLRVPALQAGAGCVSGIPAALRSLGVARAMIVTGSHFADEPLRPRIEAGLAAAGIAFGHAVVSGEPSPENVDAISSAVKSDGFDGILAIGGGSVMDAGKASAAGACLEGSIFDYLETVGSRKPDGRRLPLVCVPTTAGTGSEATTNAVLSRPGEGGFKKSIRHDNFVPDKVFLDPELQLSCPRTVSAASGMDALTQLLESWMSRAASPFTDALALSGLGHVASSFLTVLVEPGNVNARMDMAYAAYLSGITLANADLGVVHGMAGVLGSLHPIPHGVACGTLLAATLAAIAAKAESAPREIAQSLLSRMATVAEILCAHRGAVAGDLVDLLGRWTVESGIERLGAYGVREKEIDSVAAVVSNRNAVIALSAGELAAVMRSRI